jgi:DNA-binding response OmpR family regulator
MIKLGGGVMVNPEKREVYKGGELLDIREREMDMLIYFARNRGRVVSPDELYFNVWGEKPLSTSSNTVTVHILSLRKKLEDNPSVPKVIRTVWGRGYQID